MFKCSLIGQFIAFYTGIHFSKWWNSNESTNRSSSTIDTRVNLVCRINSTADVRKSKRKKRRKEENQLPCVKQERPVDSTGGRHAELKLETVTSCLSVRHQTGLITATHVRDIYTDSYNPLHKIFKSTLHHLYCTVEKGVCHKEQQIVTQDQYFSPVPYY